jgi:hypothetical protein
MSYFGIDLFARPVPPPGHHTNTKNWRIHGIGPEPAPENNASACITVDVHVNLLMLTCFSPGSTHCLQHHFQAILSQRTEWEGLENNQSSKKI